MNRIIIFILLLSGGLGWAGDDVILKNKLMEIKFSPQNYGCRAIEADGGRFIFADGGSPEIFNIEFQTPQGRNGLKISSTDNCERSFKIEKGTDGETIGYFYFKNFNLGSETNAVDVTLKIVLDGKNPKSSWYLNLKNRSKKYGAANVVYPMLRQAIKPGSGDLLFPVGIFGGKLFKQSNVSKFVRYPSFTGYTQIMGFTKNNQSLYIGAHDPEGWTKDFNVNPAQDVTIKTLVQNPGIPGQEKLAEFPFVIQILSGDWIQMAKNYRSWAVNNAPWLAKGKLAGRTDFPKSFLTPGPWLCMGWMSVNEMVTTMTRAKKNFGVPASLHWYVWHVSDFDYDYPELKPKPGFTEGTAQMLKAGNQIVPYTNGHVWDNNLPSFEKMKPFAAMKQDGSLYEEMWGTPKHAFTGMCPATSAYQNFMIDYSANLINGNNLSGLYLDQIAAVEPNWCFNPEHGHPLGVGKYWIDGYRKMLSGIQKRTNYKAGLSSECAQEMFMDTLVGNKTWLALENNDVPLLPAIYSGYTAYIGTASHEKDTFDAFAAVKARSFLWGIQPGWDQLWITNDSKKMQAAYIAGLTELRTKYQKYLVYGEFSGEIRLNNLPSYETTQNYTGPNSTIRRLSTLAVLNSKYLAEDGDYGYFFANTTGNALMLPIDIPLEKSGLYGIKIDGEFSDFVNDNAYKTKVIIPAYGVKVIEAVKLSQAKLSTLEGSKLFKLKKFLSHYNLTAEFDLSTFITFNEKNQSVKFTLRNNGDNSVNLSIKTPLFVKKVKIDGKMTEKFDWQIPAHPEYDLDFEINGKTCKLTIKPQYMPSCRLTFADEFRPGSGAPLVLPVEFFNYSNLEKKAEINLTLAKKFKIKGGNRADLTIPPQSGLIHNFEIEIPKVENPREDSGRVEIKINGEAQLKKRFKIYTPKFAPPTDVVRISAEIDGKLDEWKNIAPIILDEKFKSGLKIKDYQGNSDLSAKVYVGYDTKYFYFAAEITDNIHSQKNGEGNLWRGDGFQISFLKGVNQSGGSTGSEIDFALALTDYGAELFNYITKKYSTASRCEIIRQNNLTIYEAAFTWSEIGIFPNELNSWSFVLSDNDDGKAMKGYFELTPGIFGTKDSSAYKILNFKR